MAKNTPTTAAATTAKANAFLKAHGLKQRCTIKVGDYVFGVKHRLMDAKLEGIKTAITLSQANVAIDEGKVDVEDIDATAKNGQELTPDKAIAFLDIVATPRIAK